MSNCELYKNNVLQLVKNRKDFIMKKTVAVLSTIALIASFGVASFANSTPSSVVKTEKATTPVVQPAVVQPAAAVVKPLVQPAVKKEEVKGQKTGGAAEVRPINLTKEQKIQKTRREEIKKTVEAKKETQTKTK